MFLRKIATVVALTTLASSAWAGCGISEGRVSIEVMSSQQSKLLEREQWNALVMA